MRKPSGWVGRGLGPGAQPHEVCAKWGAGLGEKTQGSFDNEVFTSLVLGSRGIKINKTQGSHQGERQMSKACGCQDPCLYREGLLGVCPHFGEGQDTADLHPEKGSGVPSSWQEGWEEWWPRRKCTRATGPACRKRWFFKVMCSATPWGPHAWDGNC